MRTLDQLTLFPVDTHANLSALPARELVATTIATSGQHLLKLYSDWLPDSSYAKTFLAMSLWGSTRCALTWKDLATPQKRLLFQLVPRTLPTAETVFGLWPTPTATIVEETPEQWQARKLKFRKGESNFNPGLKLETAVLLPTPCAADHYTENMAANTDGNTTRGPTLGQAIHGGNGKLAPEFVEWMMGYPPGWTEVSD